MAVSRYAYKNFGKYDLEICKKSKYFNALHLLNVYNDSFEKQKIVKDMIKFMGRAKFTKQLNSDFNHIVEKKLLDYGYLNDMIETIAGDKTSPAQVTEKTPPCEIKELSKDLKYKYMVRENSKNNGNAKTILSLDIHPMTAVGLAMWLSPVFCSEVKDTFLRFTEGDPTIITEAIQNANNTTGKINNINTTTDPDTNKVSMIITTFEKNDYMAKIKNNNMKKHIQELIDEKNGIIAKKDCKIGELIKEMREERAKADEERAKADEARAKADEERAKSEARFQKLLGVAEYTKDEVIEERKIATNERALAAEARTRAIPKDVPIEDKTQVWILRDTSSDDEDFNLYPIRAQLKNMKNSIRKLKKQYGNDLVVTYKIEQPNAVIFWNLIRKKYAQNITKCSDSNWFKLEDINLKTFKTNINDMDKSR
jgi:hypothetical protein